MAGQSLKLECPIWPGQGSYDLYADIYDLDMLTSLGYTYIYIYLYVYNSCELKQIVKLWLNQERTIPILQNDDNDNDDNDNHSDDDNYDNDSTVEQ